MWSLKVRPKSKICSFLETTDKTFISSKEHRFYFFKTIEERNNSIVDFFLSRLHKKFPELQCDSLKTYGRSLELSSSRKVEKSANELRNYINVRFGSVKDLPWSEFENFFEDSVKVTISLLENQMIDTESFLKTEESFKKCNKLKYLVVNNDGGFTLLNKDGTTIVTEPYQYRENIIALLIHFSPEKLLVYDELKLMENELTLLLRKSFRNEVEFFYEKFPFSYNL